MNLNLLLGLEINLPVVTLFTNQIEGTLLFVEDESSVVL
jgi:hypothetical protein